MQLDMLMYKDSGTESINVFIDIEKTICFTGPRPKNLKGGYGLYSKGNIELGRRIRAKILELISRGYNTFISGSALGVDTIAFLVVDKIKKESPELEIRNYLFIPYEEQGEKWKKGDRERLNNNIRTSDGYLYTSFLCEEGVSYAHLLQFRNEMMVDYSSLVVGLYTEGYRGGTHNCLEYAAKKNKKVRIIDIKDLLI